MISILILMVVVILGATDSAGFASKWYGACQDLHVEIRGSSLPPPEMFY